MCLWDELKIKTGLNVFDRFWNIITISIFLQGLQEVNIFKFALLIYSSVPAHDVA